VCFIFIIGTSSRSIQARSEIGQSYTPRPPPYPPDGLCTRTEPFLPPLLTIEGAAVVQKTAGPPNPATFPLHPKP
jgi:hypothetical protein